jgi:hypothetical protein
MRSLLLTLVLGLGALGLSLAAPNQARANDFRNPAIYSGTTPVAYHWRGGTHWRGFYRGWGGYYGGYYPYGYGYYRGYRSYYPGYYRGYRSYYPGFYGGSYPWGGYGGYCAPYGGYAAPYGRGF